MAWASSKHPGSTRLSRKQRDIVLHRDPTCYLNYAGCTIRSTEDDHVQPLSQGGSNSLTNRRGACHHCHTIKSRREAAHGRTTNSRRREPETHPGITP